MCTGSQVHGSTARGCWGLLVAVDWPAWPRARLPARHSDACRSADQTTTKHQIAWCRPSHCSGTPAGRSNTPHASSQFAAPCHHHSSAQPKFLPLRQTAPPNLRSNIPPSLSCRRVICSRNHTAFVAESKSTALQPFFDAFQQHAWRQGKVFGGKELGGQDQR